MAIVASYDWESDTWSHNNDNPARTAWRAAVAEIAEKAKATLPESNGRVEKAVALVLNGDVELCDDGTATVHSATDATRHYRLVAGTCTCTDYTREQAPHGQCKHRIAYGIHKRATALAKSRLAQLDVPHPDEPDTAPPREIDIHTPDTAPHGIPQQHVVVIQGKAFVRFTGLLALAHERGLVSLVAGWTYNDAALSLAEATATFQDGRIFTEAGDATPENTTRTVAPHFRRVALTRAKARVLRDALGVELVAVEELADGE